MHILFIIKWILCIIYSYCCDILYISIFFAFFFFFIVILFFKLDMWKKCQSALMYYLLISNPNQMGSVDCLAILELGNILNTSVDLKKQMLEEDKITALFYCSGCFLQKLGIYTCLSNQFYLKLHIEQEENKSRL